MVEGITAGIDEIVAHWIADINGVGPEHPIFSRIPEL